MKRLHISLLCSCAVISLAAQAKDLKTEITVDRTIVPVEREASRLGSLTPKLLSSPVTLRSLTPVDYTESAQLTRTSPVLDPAANGDRLSLTPYRGYAAIGYFPTFNLGASAGYRFIDTDRTRLGAWLQYDGYSYKPSDEGSGSYSNNSLSVNARLEQRVGSSSALSASLGYSFSAIGFPDSFARTKQSVNDVDFNLSWWSRTGAVSYHAHASFDHFGFGKDEYLSDYISDIPVAPASENRFILKGGIGYLGSSAAPRGGIELSFDFISRNNGYELVDEQIAIDRFLTSAAPVTDGTLGVISLTPYFAVNGGDVHGRIGAKIEVSTAGAGKKFHIAPAVMLDWNAASQLAIYTTVEGGERLNSLRSLFNYCPFISGAWQYQRSHVPFTWDFGMNIGPFTGFSAKIFGGYAAANDWLMPQYAYLPLSTWTGFTNFGYYNLKSWHAGVGLSYDWRSKVKVNATAETAPNDVDKSYYLWRDRAKYVVSADIEVRPVEALKIAVGYELRACRRNYAWNTLTYEAIDLGNVSNLSVDASYAVNDAFTVFARGENLLNRRYNLITDIEAQGTKGLVGVSYKF